MQRPQDSILDRKVRLLCQDVEKWARANELWYDCDFFDYIDRVAPVEWPNTAYVLAFAADGPLSKIAISRDYYGSDEEVRLSEEFDQILERHGFWYENYDHTEMWIYAVDPALQDSFSEYIRWKWICSLIKPEFDVLNAELYGHFSKSPEALENLHWRDFEHLVAALLESQGYEVEVGPGRNDGGVDLRLLQRDPIGDIMTLVQVKRYKRDRKIRLDAVQALHGAASAEAAPESMFVTTSSYLPSARRFSRRSNVQMSLHASHDVQRWCTDAQQGIVEDKRRITTDSQIATVLGEARRDNRQILHSAGGYGMTTNEFAVVLKETSASALLLELPTRTTEHDGYGQRGREVPDLQSEGWLRHVGQESIRRARREQNGRSRRFWDGRNAYSPWNGQPAHFDYCD